MSDKPQNENENKPEELSENELDQVAGGVGHWAAASASPQLGNFEIQDLMSSYNQAETLSSNVQKKMNDTISGQQSKIG